jgi:hypothetical protein
MEITSIGQKSFKVKAKGATITLQPGKQTITKNDGVEFTIDAAGEYEVGGISVVRLPFAVVVEADGARIGADLTLTKLTDAQLEEVGPLDIVLVPTDGDTKVSMELAKQLDPWVMIPDNFNPTGFLKEMGIAELNLQPKFVASADKMPAELTIVVLENKGKDK